MKHKSVFLFILALLCLNTYSQVSHENIIKSIGLMDAKHFGVTLYSKNAGESLNTHLNIPIDYEFRNQIIRGTKNQTREKDEYGYIHER